MTKGRRGLQNFAEALHKTRQFEMYEAVMNSLRERVPQAFEKETARSSQ